MDFIYAGHTHAETSWSIREHSHPFHELVIVVRGAERVRIRDKELIIAAGAAILFPPGTPHQEWSLPPGPLEAYYTAFLWPDAPGDLPLTCLDRKGRLHCMTQWLNEEMDAYQEEAVQARRTITAALMAEFRRLAQDNTRGMVEDTRSFMRNHLQDDITLDDLAAQAQLSRFHFVRTYSALTGMTPMQDMRRLRAETARQLLLATRLPLKSIAPRVGLTSEYHLSRLIKRQFGLTAREIRGKNSQGRPWEAVLDEKEAIIEGED